MCENVGYVGKPVIFFLSDLETRMRKSSKLAIATLIALVSQVMSWFILCLM